MRALTLTQPWAGLVAAGIKLVENRPRSMIKREHFGQVFAIHASREVDNDVYRRIYDIDPTVDPRPENVRALDWFRLSRITSAVIGVAVIDTCIKADEVDAYGVSNWKPARGCARPSFRTDGAMPLSQLKWFFGPIGYVLRDVRALKTPVPCKGMLGFWTLPDDIAADVREQLT